MDTQQEITPMLVYVYSSPSSSIHSFKQLTKTSFNISSLPSDSDMLTLVLNRESQKVGVLFVLNKQGCEEFQIWEMCIC